MTDLDFAFLSAVNDILSSDPPTQSSSVLAPETPYFRFREGSDMSTASVASTSSTFGNISQAHESASSTDAVATKKPRKKRCVRKTELEILRAEVDELEIQVNFLKREEVKATAKMLGRAHVGSALPPAMRMILLCMNVNDARTIAAMEDSYPGVSNESEAAARAEMKQLVLENARLRSMVEAQLEISKNLRSICQNPVSGVVDVAKPRTQLIVATCFQQNYVHPTFVVDPRSPFASSLYNSIRASIETRYRSIDALLRECGLSDCDDLVQWNGSIRDNIARGGYIDGIDCRILPFHRRDIARVMWCFAGMEIGHSTMRQVNDSVCSDGGPRSLSWCTGQLRETSDNIVHAISWHKILVSKSETTATVHLVLKRFEEAHRIVFLWEQYTETRGMLSLRLKSEGIYLLRSPVGSDSNTHKSIAQSYATLMSPDQDETKFSRDSSMQDLTKVVLKLHHCNLDIMQHVIEAVLLSD